MKALAGRKFLGISNHAIARVLSITLALSLLSFISVSEAFGEAPTVTVAASGSTNQTRWIAVWNSPQASAEGESKIQGFVSRHLGGRFTLLTGTEAELTNTFKSLLLTPGTTVRLEPDITMYPADIPNDPYWNTQWSLQDSPTSQFGIGLPTARGYFNGDPGAGVRVAIIDTGITVHSDLPTQPISWSQNGWDFYSDDTNPSDPGDACTTTRSNSSWHGTHVAGIVAAQTNNGKGVAGIAPATQLVIARALGPCGGSLTDIADAIRWSAGLSITNRINNPPTLTNPAKVINLSLGGSSPTCSTYLQDAITAAVGAGSLVVVAAGNGALDASGFTPANCVGVVNVAAIGQTGKKAYYSDFGTSVTLAAQGGDARVNAPNATGAIYSTLNTGTTTPLAETYVPYQGTSMAAPHVAGVAALLFSAKPNLTPAELTNILTTSSTPFPPDASLTSCQIKGCGSGILNASAALALLAQSYSTVVNSVSAPVLSGIVKAGETLTTTNGQWSGFPAPALSRSWYSCASALDAQVDSCTIIAGEVKADLALTRLYVGKYIRSKIIASRDTMTVISTYSPASSVVLNNLATTFTLAGPGSGTQNNPVSYSVTPNGYFTGTITLTPTGAGLTAAQVLTFTDSNLPQTVTFTPTALDTLTVTATNSGALTNPAPVSLRISQRFATTFAVSGPSQGVINNVSGTFTIVPDGLLTGVITVRAVGGGLSSTITKLYSIESRSDSFTITPTLATPVTLTFTNTAGLANPAPLSYQVLNSLATTFSVTGPSEIIVGQVSDTYTVTPNAAYFGTITVTPNGGGLSTPVTLTYASSATPQYFTVTTTDSGTVAFASTNNQSLINPIDFNSISYVGRLSVPVVESATSYLDSYTALLSNYDSSVVYESATSRGRFTISAIDTTTARVAVLGLLPSETFTATISATKAGWKTGSTSLLSGALTGPASTPTFSAAISTSDGFTLNLINYDSAYSYIFSISLGTLETTTVDTNTVSIRIRGLNPSTSATLIVGTSRTGYYDGTQSVT